MRYIKSLALGLLFAASLVDVSGCGGGGKPTADVSGSVMLKGKAPDLEGLRICFMGSDGQPVVFDVNKDGSFKGRGVTLGENKLSLTYAPPSNQSAQPQKRLKERGPGAKDDVDPPPVAATKNPIPEQFRDAQKSPKTFTVEAGKDNVIQWDVGS
jgi:hypothetical protein